MTSKFDKKMRVDQMRILEMYGEEAKTDPKMRKFLVNMAATINELLHALDTKENEEGAE